MSRLQLVSIWDPRANGPYRGLLPHTARELERQHALQPRPAPPLEGKGRIRPDGQLARVLTRAEPGRFYTAKDLATLAQIPTASIGYVLMVLDESGRLAKRLSDESRAGAGGRKGAFMLYAVK